MHHTSKSSWISNWETSTLRKNRDFNNHLSGQARNWQFGRRYAIPSCCNRSSNGRQRRWQTTYTDSLSAGFDQGQFVTPLPFWTHQEFRRESRKKQLEKPSRTEPLKPWDGVLSRNQAFPYMQCNFRCPFVYERICGGSQLTCCSQKRRWTSLPIDQLDICIKEEKLQGAMAVRKTSNSFRPASCAFLLRPSSTLVQTFLLLPKWHDCSALRRKRLSKPHPTTSPTFLAISCCLYIWAI